MLNEEMLYEIYSVVEEIPPGMVATYGQIARLIGYPKHSRMIGKALSVSGMYGNYPCYRVVNHAGRLIPSWPLQRDLLCKEGVIISESGRIDLKKYQWKE